MKLFIYLLLLCGISVSCINYPEHLSKKEITYIKSKYSPEVINYFYEVIFYSEDNNKKINQFRQWKKDINIKITGNYTKNDIENVNEVVNIVDSLEIPIKLNIVEEDCSDDITISFGGVINNDEDIGGICAVCYDSDTIVKAKISIYERDFKVVEEELIQGLGIVCDSYSHPNSLFYEFRNINKYFSDIDKEVLKLLYEEVWPENYTRLIFEKDFSDILKSIKTSEKIKKYVDENKVSIDVLDRIKNTYYKAEDVLIKHSKDIAVRLHGNFNRKDSLQIIKTIDAINKISSNVNLNLVKTTDTLKSSGIDIRIVNIDQKGFTISNSVTKGFATMFPKIINNTVVIKFNNQLQSRERINNKITETLYKCLMPLDTKNAEFKYREEDGKIVFAEDLESMIRVVYSDAFADGYKLSDYNRLIEEMR